jgi:carbon monoxide dehydrogenase subunit G
VKITGTATIGQPVGAVYAALTDPAVLVRTIPGCQRLEQTAPDTYQATVAAGVASIKGLFDGGVRLSDQRPPESLTLHASGAGAPGTVEAVARVRLAADPSGGTLIQYDADATVGGVLGGVGQRMLTGVARKTAAEFFAAVDRDLAAAVSAAAGAPVSDGALVSAGPSVSPAPSLRAAAPAGPAPEPAAAGGGPAPAAQTVWTRPTPTRDPAQQRIRELTIAALIGAGIALLGVLLGAIVASW